MNRFFAFLALVWITTFSTFVSADPVSYDPQELTAGFITLIDQQNRVIMQTGLYVQPEDEFIDEDNRVYEVTAVNGNTAYCRYVRTEILLALKAPVAIPVQASPDPNAPLVAIYHTHTDESYIPTDGKASEPGKGSIMEVGQSLSDKLTELGLRTEHNNNLHEPHDANAYQRSRRTFMELLSHQPAALFDIHRDSVPAQIYNARINEQDVTKILLVVGRQNQNRKTTMDYAKSLKAAADQKYKGLIRGIFIAHGNYNQDLNPRAILAEIGTQYNSLDQAKRSAALFADIVPSLLTAPSSNAAHAASPDSMADRTAPPSSEKSNIQDIGFLLGAVILGAAAFLFLSTGSLNEAKEKLRKFKNTEFGDLVRFRRKRR